MYRLKERIRKIIENDQSKNDAVWYTVGYIAQAVFAEAIKGMEPQRAQELRHRLEKLGYLPEDI